MGRKESVTDRLFLIRSSVRLAVENPEVYSEKEVRELLADANYCITQLMGFRNIINAMIRSGEDPLGAARQFLDD